MSTLQIVAFRLNESYFGVEIIKVQEIMRLQPITKLPTQTPYILGVINVRGKVVPVIDTRLKLAIDYQENTEDSRLLLVEKGDIPVGLLVDEVTEVLTIPEEQIETTKDIGADFECSSNIIGVAKINDKLLTILDTDTLFN